MAVHSKLVFSKILTITDIKKRLAVPSAIQLSLPPFNGGHTVTFQFLYGTRPWRINYTIRRKGHKKPVFSGKLWRNFVACNNLNDGDRFTLYIMQGEDGSSYYRVIVGREIHFFGIPEGGENAMGCGNGTGDHQHAAAEAYPQIITCNHQGLLPQPSTPYGAELDLTLALAPPNVEGNTMIGSMARL